MANFKSKEEEGGLGKILLSLNLGLTYLYVREDFHNLKQRCRYWQHLFLKEFSIHWDYKDNHLNMNNEFL